MKSLNSTTTSNTNWMPSHNPYANLIKSLTPCNIYIDTDNVHSITVGKYSKKKAVLSSIKKVIFSNPATIVLWSDGTKTVVKCGENETFDEEKGLAIAIAKHALGNDGVYYEVFKKWLPNDEDRNTVSHAFDSFNSYLKETLGKQK